MTKMLSMNVLCMKKKQKKRSYYITDLSDNFPTIKDDKEKRRKSNSNMLHITEDTPADMLSGAMDLSIHLPSGKTIKMCVERSTPMMDLLVQITTNHQLQITNYTLQPLQAASPDNDGSFPEKILTFYPNTPIGTLDTQIVKVVPKIRTLNKNLASSGHQPFESTFRLKVHLPRNQLYVTRVSRHVQIGEIMRKVCEEKNLDPNNCEVRHPGNFDEVLDPKLSLNDYMITEINLILKGTKNSTQTFTSNDIMNNNRKEEERKQMHNKTGGGVFNLIFRRGKTNSTENSTTHMTNTTVAPSHAAPSRNLPEMMEKPRAPQRKRRPAPKPPSITIENPTLLESIEIRTNSNVSDDNSDIVVRKTNETNNLTICHSRHSSDSSGYHETSILSDHCNTSLPRKHNHLLKNRHSDSMGNLREMTVHSKSMSSLAFPGRKKKAAPPPPTPLSTSSMSNLDRPSPVVASQTHLSKTSPKRADLPYFQPEGIQNSSTNTNPPPLVPRRRNKPPVPRPRSSIPREIGERGDEIISCPYHEGEPRTPTVQDKEQSNNRMSTTEILRSLEYLNLDEHGNEIKPPEIIAVMPKKGEEIDAKKRSFVLNLIDKNLDDDNTSVATESPVREDEFTSLESEKNDRRNSWERQTAPPHSISEEQKSDIPPTPPTSLPPIEDLEILKSISPFEEVILRKWGNASNEGAKEEEEEQENTLVSGGDFSSSEPLSAEHSMIENLLLDPPKTFDEKNNNVKNMEFNETPIYENGDILMKDYNIESPKDSGNSSDISEKSKLDEDLNEDVEIIPENNEWQLPSPPKMFKDTSTPSCQNEQTEPNEPSEPNSCVLTPELFKKLKVIEEKQQIEDTSDNASTTSEDRLVLNKLSLENLEKRRSLVYNRELATSLKLNFSSTIENEEINPLAKQYNSELNLSNSLTQFEKTLDDIRKNNEKIEERSRKLSETLQTTTLPNFKISTYDEPKRIIKVFEDDTIRSNSEDQRKTATLEPSKPLKVYETFENTASPEKVQQQRVYRKSEHIKRPVKKSESFSQNNEEWSPSKPVARSKSHISLKNHVETSENNMSKSNSLFDVSGLQSLEVMKKIQNTLNTPTTSMETLTTEKTREMATKHEEKKQQYTFIPGPPSINMSTWSERPKVPVSVKEDSDYKLGKGTHKANSKVMLLGKSDNSVVIKTSSTHFTFPRKTETQNVTINLNNTSERISEKNGNVLIKIGEAQNEFRTPLGNLNKNSLRPHSVASPSEFENNEDISRIPVVRSVELKKNFKESNNANNTSVVHLNENNESSKTIQRAKSLLQTNPVVKGFRNRSETDHSNHRHSWQVPERSESFTTNQNVPFSRFTLRKTAEFDGKLATSTLPRPWVKPSERKTELFVQKESENSVQPEVKIERKIERSSMPPPPPPPEMPKIIPKKMTKRQFVPVVNPRDELLKSIRDFGGKKGLRSRKA